MIDTGGGRHVYQAIAWDIRDKIMRGDLRPGDTIPSLPAIRDEHGVSYSTAQAAVALLKAWGLVRSEPSRGTFVLEIRPVTEIMSGGWDKTWRQVAAEYGMTGSQRIVGAGQVEAPPDVADEFGCEAGALVTWRQRLILADQRPVQISTSYYPSDIARAVPALGSPERLSAWSFELIARAGWEVSGGTDTVTSKAAGEGEAALLEVDIGTPVSEVLRVAKAGDKVVSVERMVSNSTRIRQTWKF